MIQVQAFLASLEPLYKDYVLRRKAERISYRDIGTFREFACEKLCEYKFSETVWDGFDKSIQVCSRASLGCAAGD
eukprot:762930-Hanusia_phi.AAC.5